MFRPKRGWRYVVRKPLLGRVMVQWFSPLTTGSEITVPVGLRFKIRYDPPPTALSVGTDPEPYEYWEKILVDEADRKNKQYGGYTLSVGIDQLDECCERLQEDGRAEYLRSAKPDLMADLTLYPSELGGRKHPAFLGLMWPCTAEPNPKPGFEAFDGCPLLADGPLRPGEMRRVGFVFLSGRRAADHFRKSGVFYLWEGRSIGEARVVPEQNPD